MSVMAADIGGTHSRLVWLDDHRMTSRHYRNVDFSDFYQVIDRFRQEAGWNAARMNRMVLALPAPVDTDPVKLTNIDWEVDRQILKQRFPSSNCFLINDFQAAAVGAIHVEDQILLNPGAEIANTGPAVVTGAGTGLGLSWFADIATATLPQATEGGHMDFAPFDQQQRDLHAWLQKRYGHVSYERLLSGSGLGAIHAFMQQQDRPQIEAQAIHAAALQNDTAALGAIDLFVRIFGAYVGNLALAFNPKAGIYLCGGVVGHLAQWFGEGFREAYLEKGRMRHAVARIPVYLLTQPDVGLQGAIKIAKGGYIQ